MKSTTNDPEPSGPSAPGSRSTLWYVAAIGSIGTAVILHSLWQVTIRPVDWHWLLLAGLTVAGSAAVLRMSAVPVSFSVAEVFTFSALLLFGPAVGTLTVAIDCSVISLRLARRGLPWRRCVLNVTAPPLGMWIAAHFLFALVDVNRLVSAQQFADLVLPLSLSALVYYVLDTGMIAVAIALEQRKPAWQVWRDNFVQLWLSFLVGAHAAGVIVVALGDLGLSFLVIVAPLPLLVYYAMRTWIARVNEQIRHLAEENEQTRKLQEQQSLQLQTEVALRERDHQFLAVFDSAMDAMLLVDDVRCLVNANSAACRLFDIDRDALPATAIDTFLTRASSADITTQWDEMLRKGEHQGELVVAANAGEHIVEFSFKAAVVPGRHLFIWRDVSERKRLEAQLRQSQKMETVGRLAGGVAHDFNNLLTVILGNAGMALERADPVARESINEVISAADRAANLTRQLLAFSRKQVLQTSVVNINTIVGGVERMLRRLLDESIELRTTLAPDVGSVKVDTSQLEQVIVNLVVNARDAMPDGGRVQIETTNVEIGPRVFGRMASDVPPGSYVRFSVSDTGVGMDDSTRSQIFEPFFTTKAREKGTGLGLATVYGIVQQSGGHLNVQSAPGVGSTFSVYLPKVEAATAPLSERKEASGPLAGSETILLVEDEEAVRLLATLVLKRYGYSVVAAPDPDEAIRLSEENSIHLLVTDVVMPRMNGKDLASTLCGRIPKLRVVFMSGYTGDTVAVQAVTTDTFFLQKPFSPAALAAIVRQALDAPAPSAARRAALSGR